MPRRHLGKCERAYFLSQDVISFWSFSRIVDVHIDTGTYRPSHVSDGLDRHIGSAVEAPVYDRPVHAELIGDGGLSQAFNLRTFCEYVTNLPLNLTDEGQINLPTKARLRSGRWHDSHP